MVIRSNDDFIKIPWFVTSLYFIDNFNPSLTSLDLDQFKLLRDLEIGKNCFRDPLISSFSIHDLHRLDRVQVGDNSFSQLCGAAAVASGVVEIRNCAKLTEIRIQKCAFVAAGALVLEALPALKLLEIGTQENSYSFYRAAELRVARMGMGI